MAAAGLTVEVRVRARWWVPVYLRTLAFLCVLFDAEPRMDRVVRTLTRWGLTVDLRCGERWRRIR